MTLGYYSSHLNILKQRTTYKYRSACFVGGKHVFYSLMETIQTYDLAIAWNWEYDKGFIEYAHEVLCQNEITVLEIRNENVEEIFSLLRKGKIRFRYFLDRASDEDEMFQPMAMYVLGQFRSRDRYAPHPFNPYDLQLIAADKATMHLEFLANRVEVPYTIIVSPYNHKEEVELSLSELAKLGRPFIIKPANTTGGGIGVVIGAETLKEIIDARQSHKNDKYLLQKTITPTILAGHRAWIRVFYAFGEIIPSWWNDITHIYSLMPEDEERHLSLGQLRTITERIHSICQLEFFSTEFAFTADGRCVAVDYVNEMCDMRLQSQFSDGVPDIIVQRIIRQMMERVKFINL
jgi:hypothetical protein